jgi:hypothetical protein
LGLIRPPIRMRGDWKRSGVSLNFGANFELIEVPKLMILCQNDSEQSLSIIRLKKGFSSASSYNVILQHSVAMCQISKFVV